MAHVFVEDPKLPTVEQCVRFMELINIGRKAAEMEPVDALDFDACEAGSNTDCLSATHLFIPAGFSVGYDYVREVKPNGGDTRVLAALNMEDGHIPSDVLAVTDPFDAEVDGLRERMVEAGVVKP